MAKVVGSQVKLDNGQLITPQQGGWYDGQQFWGGTLSNPGQINTQSNQQGAGSYVSKEVVQQTNPANWDYIQAQQKKMNVTPTNAPGTPGGFSAASSASVSGPGVGDFGAPAPINLPDMYKNLYSAAGIDELQKKYSDMEKTFIETKGKINDNPFLSEATRVGRVSKLETLFNERTANIKNDIATKKADIETQINLQTKQFDINSQQARDNLSRFNTLLEAGAYDNASGDDIATATRLTGLSSSAIYSAVQARKDKNLQTQVVTATDDNGNVTAVVIDQKSGAIISKTSLGSIGNKENAPTATESDKKQYYANALRGDAGKGASLSQIFNAYSGYLDPDLIYQLYNSSHMENGKLVPDKNPQAKPGTGYLQGYGVTLFKSSTSSPY